MDSSSTCSTLLNQATEPEDLGEEIATLIGARPRNLAIYVDDCGRSQCGVGRQYGCSIPVRSVSQGSGLEEEKHLNVYDDYVVNIRQ